MIHSTPSRFRISAIASPVFMFPPLFPYGRSMRSIPTCSPQAYAARPPPSRVAAIALRRPGMLRSARLGRGSRVERSPSARRPAMIPARSAVIALALSLPAAAAAQEQGIHGTWWTKGKQARVEIAACEDASKGVCGKIVWLAQPNDAKGRPDRQAQSQEGPAHARGHGAAADRWLARGGTQEVAREDLRPRQGRDLQHHHLPRRRPPGADGMHRLGLRLGNLGALSPALRRASPPLRVAGPAGDGFRQKRYSRGDLSWNSTISVLRTPVKPDSRSRPCQLLRTLESETAKA